MANLDAVVKELQQERDRLDKAIAVLASLDGTRPHKGRRRTNAWTCSAETPDLSGGYRKDTGGCKEALGQS